MFSSDASRTVTRFPRATEGDGDASDLEDESEPDAQGAEADSEDEQMMAEVAVHQVAKAAPMAMPECIAFRHWMSGVVHLSPVVTSDDDGEAMRVQVWEDGQF